MNATSTTANSNSNSNSNNKLPSRLSETSFRRYEDVIAQIVESYPAVVKCLCNDKLSLTTFSARLRDAILSLDKFDWKTEKINVVKFKFNIHDIVVSQRSNGVFAGSRVVLKYFEQITVFSKPALSTEPTRLFERVSQEVTPLELNNLTRDELKFLCLLTSKRAFARPIQITCEWFDDENKVWFEDNFDVAFDAVSDKQHTFILT